MNKKADDKETIAEAETARLAREKARIEAQPPKTKGQPKPLAVEERNGQAVALVDVPAHTAEVPLASSKIDGVISATVEAWHEVKGHDDAEFALCVSEFRRELVNHAEEVWTKNVITEGDTVMARFEREVAKIKLREEDKKAAKTA